MVMRRCCSWCGHLSVAPSCEACGHRADVCRLDCDCTLCRGSGFAREAATANPFRGYSDERLCELAQQYFREGQG